MTPLICVSLAKIEAAKSHICIIDRAEHEIPPNNCISWQEVARVVAREVARLQPGGD